MATVVLPDFGTLTTRFAGGVLHVSLNRPETRNAMSLAMVSELHSVLMFAQECAGVRVIVLRGTHGHFCAGADLKEMASARMRLTESGADAIAEVNAQFGELCVAFAATPLPIVAVLEGTVMGAGVGLACVADVALAVQGAVFRLPETGLGVVPAQIAAFLVERVGYSQAKRLAVTGGQVAAEAALGIGLVHAVHGREAVDAALALVLSEILACAPGAIAATKALMAKARFTPPAEMVSEAAVIFAQAARGPEGIEGGMAFLQKRVPNWVAQ